MKDLRQDSNYTDYIQRLGWNVEDLHKNRIFIKKLPLGISFAKLQRTECKIDKDKLKDLVKKYRIIYILVEPKNIKQYNYFQDLGYKVTKDPSLPTRTIQFNLLKSQKILLAEMHHKARYNIGLSKKRGVKIKNSGNIKEFSEFWQESSKSWGMFLSQKKEIKGLYKSFGKNAVILNAYFQNELIAAVLLVSTKNITYYMYAASSEKGNKFYAPSLLIWESIRLAKKSRKKIFDFGGIYDERFPLKNWKGFTEFKRKFGGNVVEYPGPLFKYFNPF